MELVVNSLAPALGWAAQSWLELALLAVVVVVLGVTARTIWLRVRETRQLRTERDELSELRNETRPKPRMRTLQHSMTALNEMLDLELRSIDALDRKAALIPTALGVAATILAGQVDPAALEKARTAMAGIVTVVMGLASAATAVAVFFPRVHAIGAKPYMLARYTDEETARMDQAVANELAWACHSIKELNAVKAGYLFLSLTLLVGTVVTAVLFAVSGGFGGGTGQTGSAAFIGA